MIALLIIALVVCGIIVIITGIIATVESGEVRGVLTLLTVALAFVIVVLSLALNALT